MTPRIFSWPHRVSYAECTVGDHVYYGRYLDFLERGRGEFFRVLGCPMNGLQERGVIFPVTECRLQFSRPARYDDSLTIEIWMNQIRRVRLEFGYRVVHEDGGVVVNGTTTHACTDLADRPIRIPVDLADGLRTYLRLSQEETNSDE